MYGVRSWLLACVGVGVVLLTGCPVEPPTDVATRIEYFVADSTLVRRGAEVGLQWDARNAAVYEGFPSCSISRRFEGGEAQRADPVSCQGDLAEVPAAPLSAGYVNYQLNVLRRPYDGSDPEPYLTRVIRVELQELEPDDPQTSIDFFSVDSTTIVQGDPVVLSWAVRNPGVAVGAPSCSLSWRYEGGEPMGPSEVACTGSLQEVPNPPGSSTTYVRYQLNALKSPVTTADPYLTAVVTVTLLEAPQPVEVTVGPTNTTIETGDLVSLSATVTGASNTAVSWAATCGSIVASGASSATFTAPAVPGSCTVTATSVADPTKRATAVIDVILSGEALAASIARVEVVRSAYPYPGGTSDPYAFGESKTTGGAQCGFDGFGGFGVSDSAGDHRWMCLDWSAQAGSWESGLTTRLEVRTASGVTLCAFAFTGTARSARVDLSGCSTAPSETLYARVGREDALRVAFGPLQAILVLPLITAERPAESAYYLLANTFQFEWDPKVPLPASAELHLRMYDIAQATPTSMPSRGAAWNVYYDLNPSNVTALISSVPINDGSHYRWFMRAEEVLDSISSSYSLSDKYRLCRSESSGSSANCSFGFTGRD